MMMPIWLRRFPTPIQTRPLAALILLSCGTGQVKGQDLEPDWPAVARLIAERMDLQPGEKVLLVGHPERGRFEPLIRVLRRAVLDAEAIDVGRLDFIEGRLDSTFQASRSALKQMFSEVDVAVMLPGAQTNHAAYLAMQDVLRGNRARTVHFHWTGAFLPDGSPKPVDETVDRRYQKALLEADYDSIAASQRAFERAARAKTVRVTTPAGTDLSFRIGQRPVTKQDGDASAARARAALNLIDREIELPCGVIRTAPIEDSVNGVIVFPPSRWSGSLIHGLRIRFAQGRAVSIEADGGADSVRAELEAAGPQARRFREFGLGFNPLLAIDPQHPWIPYYGYGAGVVRLSLGDNQELGGDVTGGYVRWNFFLDATVTVGDEIWVRDGRLVAP